MHLYPGSTLRKDAEKILHSSTIHFLGVLSPGPSLCLLPPATSLIFTITDSERATPSWCVHPDLLPKSSLILWGATSWESFCLPWKSRLSDSAFSSFT